MRSFFIAIPVAFSVIGLGGACSGADPAGTATTPGEDAAADVCGHSVLGSGSSCSPTKPCAYSYLDCYYAPGCDYPQGHCEVWGRCADTGGGQSFCSCDGKLITNSNQPIASGPTPPSMSCGDAGADASGDGG